MPLPRTSSFVPEAFENEHRIAIIELSSMSKSGGGAGAGREGGITGGGDTGATEGTGEIVPVGEGATGTEEGGGAGMVVAEGAGIGRGRMFSAGGTPPPKGSAKYRFTKNTIPNTTKSDTAKIIGADTAAFVRFKKSIY